MASPLPLQSEQKTLAALASMALLAPAQAEMVQREMRSVDEALHGRPLSRYEGITAAELDMSAADMTLLRRSESENRAEVQVPDPAVLRDMYQRNQETLRMGTGPALSVHDKNRLWKLAKDWKETIRRGMPSYEQLERPTQENLDVFMTHEQKTMKHQLAFRNAMRLLDRENETVFIESLRPTTPSHIDWDSYYRGFEKVYFSDEAERQLQVESLDDDVYLAYLRLRAQGVETPKLIMRTLNLSQVVYEACKMRLDDEMREVHVVSDEDDAPPKGKKSRTEAESAPVTTP